MTSDGKKRILYLNHTGQVSGAEKVLLNVLRGLNRSKYEAVALCPFNGELHQLIAAADVPCISIPLLQARFTWRPDRLLQHTLSLIGVIAAIRSQVEKLDPDFIHANTVRAAIAATIATAFTNRVVLWHVHDTLPRHLFTFVIRWLASASKRVQIVAVSHASAKALCGNWHFNGRVEVLHNGIDLSRFPWKDSDSSGLKQELGLASGSFLVCAVGQICARKQLRELVCAFAKIAPARPELALAIVGKPVFAHEKAYHRQLLRDVHELGLESRVHFTGERQDIALVLQAADLLVLNSSDEPFGLVLVEAMSCGTPVLATRVGGIPEIVTHGETGWLIESGETYALSAKLAELSQNKELLERVARHAQRTVCPRFSLERFLFNLHSIYAELPDRSDGTLPIPQPIEGGQRV